MQNDKLSEIDLQIKSLQEKKKKLEEKQHLQLAQMIKKTGAASLQQEILIGALLDAVKALQEKKDVIKKWEQMGKDFLKFTKGEVSKKAKASFLESSNQN